MMIIKKIIRIIKGGDINLVIVKGDCKITLEEETKCGKGKGSLAAVGNLLFQ